jgi:Uma2 family endonuclease
MSTALPVANKLFTAEEYLLLADDGRPTELIRGRIVEMNPPGSLHGKFCGNIVRALAVYLDHHDVAHLVSNDSGVITNRTPDSVRGPDVAIYSYQRIPRENPPDGYWPAAPELVFEVRSPNDRWVDVVAKAAEFLNAGVLVAVVLDPQERKLHIYSADRPTQILSESEQFAVGQFLPEVLPDCILAVRDFLR